MADLKTLAKLATTGHLWRPDWPEKSLYTYLVENHAGDADYELAVAAFVCWTDPATNTPARLKENGPWWRAARAAASLERGTLTGPPRRGEDCPTHPGHHRDYCAGCRADALVEATGRTD